MDATPTRHSARLASKARLKAREAENATTHVLLNTFTASSSKASRLSRPHKSKNKGKSKSKSKNKDSGKDVSSHTVKTARARQSNVTKKPKPRNAHAQATTTAPQTHRAPKASKKRPLPEDQNNSQDAGPKKKRRCKPKKADALEVQPMDVKVDQQQQQALALPPRPINPTDPCERLPTEVWHQILAQLPLSQAATTSLVSKTWLDGALSWPKWRRICEDLKLGSPKRKFKTFMSIVCLHSYFICDLCFSYSTGFRKFYGSQIPLPVDIPVQRLNWEKEVEKAESVERVDSAESAQPKMDVPQQDVSDVERTEPAPSSQPPPSVQQTEPAFSDQPPAPVQETVLAPPAVASSQPPPVVQQSRSALSNQSPPSVQQTESAPLSMPLSPVQEIPRALFSLPQPSPAQQHQHLAESRHIQLEQVQQAQICQEHIHPSQLEHVQPTQLEHIQPSPLEYIQQSPLEHIQPSQLEHIQPSQLEHVQPSQCEKIQVSHPEQVSQVHIPEGVLDAGVAERMRQAISQLIMAAKLSQELATAFRAQVKTSTVQPQKNPGTAPQVGATTNNQTAVANTQDSSASSVPALPAKLLQPVERWNLCQPCRLKHYRAHPQPTRPVYDMYSGRTTNGQRKKLARMCKTRALGRYGLSADDICDLDYIERRNPHHGSWNPMMLYSIRDLQRRALAVHGGWVGVDAFKNGVNKKRRTAFNARLELWKMASKIKQEERREIKEDDTSAAHDISPTLLA